MVRSRALVSVAAVALVVVGLLAGPPASAADPGAAARCDGRPVTITGTDGDDVLVGTTGPDVIAALGGNDIIHGHGGDDVICAGDGSDLLRGGAGNDRQFGEEDGESGDDLVGGAGDDYLDGGIYWHYDKVVYRGEPAGIDADLQTGLVTTDRGTDTIVRPGDTAFYASRYADTVEGSDSADTIFGMRGDDTLNGRGGSDRMYGRADDDSINGGGGCDMIYGERGDDVLDAVDNGFHCWLVGGPGDDHLIGTAGWDIKLSGGPGNDLIEGFGDADKLRGGVGDDTLDGGGGTDNGDGKDGTDTCLNIEQRRSCENPAPTRG